MPNYHLNKRWKKVDDATDCPNVFATMSGTSGNYVSDLSGAEIYSLLQENPKQLIILCDTNGRPCLLTTPPTSGASSLVFSTLVDTTLYKYTIANGGNAISVSTTNVSGSSNNIFIFHISRDLTSGYTMDTTWSAIAEAKSAGKLIVANPGTDKVYYDCGDPLDEGISLSRVFPAPSGLKVDSFTISSDGTITYSGEVPVTAENVVKYTEQSLSSAQKAQACANIGATKKTEVVFSYTGTDALCSMTYSALSTAKANGELLVPRYINMYGTMSVGSNDKFVFTIPTVDLSAESLVIYTFTVDSEDNVEYNESEFSIHAGISDDVKTALLNCFAHVAWVDTHGQDYYDALESALYPQVHLSSITAAYEQDRPIYDTDSIETVIATINLDLSVVANYSDGTTETLSSSDYTISGTVEVGSAVPFTVTYEGKTATINVLIMDGGALPTGYTRIEYVERPSGTGTGSGYNTTGFMLNGTDDAVIEMGVMLKATPSSNAGGYFLACRQTNGDNTVGFGIYAPKDTSSIGAYDGESCLVPPHSGQSVIDQKFDLVVTKTPTTLTVSDGVNTNTVTRTPRVMVQNLHVFGLVQYNAAQLSNPVIGRIYYLKIVEGGIEKVNFIPCVRNSDNAVGFWNSVAEEFKTAVAYVAGPEV